MPKTRRRDFQRRFRTTVIKTYGPVFFAIQRNPILSYSSKFSKNHFFLYSNQNPIISYSVDPTTFYILHTYFIPLFTSYTPISYHLLHLTHLFPTTFYILHTYTLPPFTSYTPIPYHLLPKFLESCLNPILIINHQNPVQITSQTDPIQSLFYLSFFVCLKRRKTRSNWDRTITVIVTEIILVVLAKW